MLRNIGLRVVSRLQAGGRDEKGQGLAEYGLILAMIAVVCVGAVGAFGTAVRDSVAWKLFDAIGN